MVGEAEVEVEADHAVVAFEDDISLPMNICGPDMIHVICV